MSPDEPAEDPLSDKPGDEPSTEKATPDNDPWILVAKILRPHGLRGMFRLRPETREVTDLVECDVDRFHVRHEGEIIQSLTRASARIHKNLVQMKFEEIPDRSAAEKFINMELVIAEEDRWDLPDGEYYIDDLKGMSLLNEAGEKIGQVVSAQTGSVHDFLEIAVDIHEGKKALLPNIPEFVLKIDPATRSVTVAMPEGLFD